MGGGERSHFRLRAVSVELIYEPLKTLCSSAHTSDSPIRLNNNNKKNYNNNGYL